MTDQETNIAIAEACGWRNVRMTRGCPFWGDSEGQLKYNAIGGSPPNAPLECLEEIPNYTGSLDAMSEIEGTLTEEQRKQYERWLVKIVVDGNPEHWVSSATARQRATAFLAVVKGAS